MPEITYQGPSHQLRVRTDQETVLLPRRQRQSVSDEVARLARRKAGDRVTVHVDLEQMTVDELRAAAAERGLPTVGTKADLVARLNDPEPAPSGQEDDDQ